MSTFATSNNLTVIDRVDQPTLPGARFELHRNNPSRWSEKVFRLPTEHRVEFGEFIYLSHRAQMRTAYIAIELPEPVPNIVLDAKRNQVLGLSSLSVAPHRSQRLSLEGDFDDTFALSCPTGYEADALYLVSPDVMANLIDGASAFDVELVDNWVILTTPGFFRGLHPATWRGGIRAVNAITAKVEQWRRWRDDRHEPLPAAHGSAPSPDISVAEPGRGLRAGFNWPGLLLAVIGRRGAAHRRQRERNRRPGPREFARPRHVHPCPSIRAQPRPRHPMDPPPHGSAPPLRRHTQTPTRRVGRNTPRQPSDMPS